MKIAPINRNERLFSIGTICNAFDLKRDAYYKYQKRSVIKKQIEQDVIGLVRESRRTLPREGTRKLMRSLKNEFNKYDLKVGRD
jgi:putative transposase